MYKYRERISNKDLLGYSIWDTLWYLQIFSLLGIIYLVLRHFWAEYFLLRFSDLNNSPITFDGMASVWPLYLLPIICALYFELFSDAEELYYEYESDKGLLLRYLIRSINAGFWEELIFRWQSFFIAMVLIQFFDWASVGLIGRVFRDLLIPLVNWVSFGFLAPQLDSWVIGASLISSAFIFGMVHNKGIASKINSFLIGMVCFWVMFNHGILTAIATHAIYDLIVYMSAYAHYLHLKNKSEEGVVIYVSLKTPGN